MKLAAADALVIMIILTILKLTLNVGTAEELIPEEKIAALSAGVCELCEGLGIITEVQS